MRCNNYGSTQNRRTGLNTLRPRQNGRHFADDTFKRIFMNENARLSIIISLKFVPKGLINHTPVLVQIMAWRRPGDKPLSEPMMVNLLTHICVTRPQWLKCNTIACIIILNLSGGYFPALQSYCWKLHDLSDNYNISVIEKGVHNAEVY